MASQRIANHREGAEIYHGEALCKQKCLELLDKIQLPKGLFPLDGLIEMGINRITGFVWLKRNERKEHKNRTIGTTSSYATEVTAFIENRRLRKLVGVKSKEFLIWIHIAETYIDEKNLGKITFSTPAGLSRSFPISAFELEGKQEKKLLRIES